MALSARKLERIAKGLPALFEEYKRGVMNEFADYVRAELEKQHLQGRNLYGRKYPKPKKGNPPMLDTGNLMSGYVVTIIGTKLIIDNAVTYSIYLEHDGQHQHLPNDNDMPPKWAAKLAQIKAKQGRKLDRALTALGR